MIHPYTGEIKPCPFCGNQPGHYNLHDSLHPTGREWFKSPELDIKFFGEDADTKYSYEIISETSVKYTERGQYWTFSCLEEEFGCGASFVGSSMEDVMHRWNRRV